VELGPFAFGDYDVTGTLSGDLEGVAFEARTTAYPWAGIALIAVALEWGLLAGRRRLRRRVSIDLFIARPGLSRRVAAATLAALPPTTDGGGLTSMSAEKVASRVVARVTADRTRPPPVGSLQ
jgi:hypothetical protein